jgi:hypothetical protein
MAAHVRHDLFPDMRRQLLPRGDKLAQNQISAGSMQTWGKGVDASSLLRRSLRILGRGCSSRRLHFLCCNLFLLQGLVCIGDAGK